MSTNATPRQGALVDDHLEIDLGVAAAVTDRGLVHDRNEDAFHVEAVVGVGVAAVVCDGVSVSHTPRARGTLRGRGGRASVGRRASSGSHRPGRHDRRGHRRRTTRRAEGRAPHSAWRNPPSCTLVSAVCRADDLAIGWVGDSRAYWITADEHTQLTTDNSWAREQVEAGLMTEPEAGADPRAHQITRWLGGDAPDLPPQIVTFHAHRPGRLVLCSDGLSGYLSSAEQLGRLLDAQPSSKSLVATARHLVGVALAAGGDDNVTVAIVDAGSSPMGGAR